ncbi:MAG: 5'-nucleotidase C-terminal domain-containing protein [Clostridia bacterium]|nr:5'-nucleotidase C-terminal domain-containing protein [Clostridia bacterium]
MKKWLLSGALALIFALTGCSFAFGDGESSSLRESSSMDIVGHIHIDKDRDRICDDCGESWGTSDSSSETPSKPSHVHTDGNNDGICDDCTNPIEVTLDFYSINDLHGKFDDSYANIGVDELTTYLRNAKTQNENTILLSAGDMWQGSAESNYTKGNIITDWMNDLDFAAMTIGNHEFDWGESYIEANEEIARFPFLAINIYNQETRQRAEYCDASVMVERSGAKIGIIGAIGDCYSDIAVEQTEEVYFKTGYELTALVKAESKKLREQGADMIVYVIHDGESSGYTHYDESLSNGFVDLVFEGHTHQVVRKQDSYGVWHLQGGGDNSDGISHAQVVLNTSTDEMTVTAKTVYKSTYQNKADDPVVDALLAKYADELEKVNEVLGYNDSYKNSSALANFAAKAMYTAGQERWGADSKYADKIVLGGGFMSVRSPYYLPAGQVTYGSIYTLFTFDNPIVLCKVSGSRLKSQFINTTNSHYYMYYGTGGAPTDIVDSQTYYVVVDTYCANYDYYGMGYLEIVDYYDSDKQVFTRDLVADLIKEGGMSSNGNKPVSDGVSTSVWAVASGYGGSSIDDYDTGTYGKYTVSGILTEYYRAYKPKSETGYLMQLLPFAGYENDGSEGGAFYNTAPLYGIRSIEITYKCDGESAVYTADDRVGMSKRYTLEKASSYTTVTLYVDTDNFFRVETESKPLLIKAFKVNYTGKSNSYSTDKNDSGTWDIRLNPTVYEGTLVAGESSVSVPVKVEYVAGRYEVTATKTYTYYTLEYVEANPSVKAKAAMLTPQDVAAYYAAFEEFPANYAVKNFSDGNSWSEVSSVFGEDTRYVSEYSRTDGYAQYVPYISSGLLYYEFDIDLDGSYGKSSRGVGRVVAWANGWNADGYDKAPVSVYTDDHYATFQEYLNTGEFGVRFDAERNLTFFEWTAPETIIIE